MRVAACGYPRTTCFVAVSAVLLARNLSAADRTMGGDAARYWSLDRTFTLGNDAIGILACFALASAAYSQILGAPPSFEIWCL
jgi:hypothetical protein